MSSYVVYLWEPSLSPHKLGLYHALKAHPRVERVVYVAQENLTAARRAQGWEISTHPGDEIILAPGEDEVREIIETSRKDAIHIFAGMRHVPCVVQGLAAVQRLGRRFGLMSEPRAAEGLLGRVRLAQSWITEGGLRRGASFVLAIGKHGPSWFVRSGYPTARVFPFAYFLDDTPPAPPQERMGITTVGFVGRLESSKGFDLYLQAGMEVGVEVQLRVAGTGSLLLKLLSLQRDGHLNVQYDGVLPIREVHAFMKGIDVLVLPSASTNDGWGAVVSEALLAGTAVVTSDRVGASICLESADGLGRVVTKRTPQAVARAIEDLVNSHMLSAAARERRAAWAQGRLTGAAGAAHLVAILDHVIYDEPRPPPYFRDAPLPGAPDLCGNHEQLMA